MELLHFDKFNTIDRKRYIVIRFNGLYGDMLNGCCKLKHILDKLPDVPWIIIHSYGNFEKIKDAMDVMQYWINNGKIKYYFADVNGGSSPMSANMRTKINDMGIADNHIFDFYVFRHTYRCASHPLLGIDIPKERNLQKAIIFRYSGWHSHFPSRNRPYEEWKKYELMLLNKGYSVYLLGQDDTMPTHDKVIDLRKKMSIYEILNFTKDANICLTTTTFLYLWTQFICPTAVFADTRDMHNLHRFWKFSHNLHLMNTSMPLLDRISTFINRRK